MTARYFLWDDGACAYVVPVEYKMLADTLDALDSTEYGYTPDELGCVRAETFALLEPHARRLGGYMLTFENPEYTPYE